MVNAKQLLFDSYEQLISIKRNQLSIAAKEKFEEQISEIRKLELQAVSPKTSINSIRLEEQLYDKIVVDYQREISSYIQELQRMNNELQQILDNWYTDTSGEMKQVTIQRKTLQTYGGVNNSDIISYYIDDKK